MMIKSSCYDERIHAQAKYFLLLKLTEQPKSPFMIYLQYMKYRETAEKKKKEKKILLHTIIFPVWVMHHYTVNVCAFGD